MSDADQERAGAVPSEPSERGTTTAAPPQTKPARPKVRQLPPFKVLLHNDDVNDVEHVIRSILRLTSLSLEDALGKTLEAHHAGVSLLLVTHQERAELYCEQFATFNLTVTAEADA